MAKPVSDAPAAAAVRALAGSTGRLAVRVVPGARSEAVELAGDHLRLKVRAKPHAGAANDAVLSLLAGILGVPASRLQLLRGATSRSKLVQLPPAEDAKD